MAEITHSGQNTIASLDGRVRIEQGSGRIIFFDDDASRVLNLGLLDDGKHGADWYDSETEVNYMRAGELPNNTGGLVVAKPPNDVDDLFI